MLHMDGSFSFFADCFIAHVIFSLSLAIVTLNIYELSSLSIDKVHILFVLYNLYLFLYFYQCTELMEVCCHLQCDLLNMLAVAHLEKDDKYGSVYELLKIFLTQRLHSYLEFQTANWILND
jgi:hypothetical protein